MAALAGLLQLVGAALQRLTGMHKSKVTGHSAYLSASTAPGTDGDVEVLWYSSQVRAVLCSPCACSSGLLCLITRFEMVPHVLKYTYW